MPLPPAEFFILLLVLELGLVKLIDGKKSNRKYLLHYGFVMDNNGNVGIGTTKIERAITLKTNKYDGAIHLETTKNNNSFSFGSNTGWRQS